MTAQAPTLEDLREGRVSPEAFLASRNHYRTEPTRVRVLRAPAFRTWNRNGTSAVYHRTTVLNRAADEYGRKGYEAARAVIGPSETVSGVVANEALDAAKAA